MYKRIFSYLVIFIVITNLPFIANPIRSLVDNDYLKYSNEDGSYTFHEKFFKQQAIISTSTNRVHPDFIKKYPETQDTIIYRLYWRNPLCFWRWGYYLFDKRYYTFQYKNWNEIKRMRDKKEAAGVKLSEDWMDF